LSGSGTVREVTEFWLTEAQAYVVCRRSNAPNAPLVSKMLIQVFTPASAAMAAFGESCRRR
jgi:hypothetical protein